MKKISVLLGIVVVSLLLTSCNRPATKPSSCDGISTKKVGITRGDYSACANEMLALLQSIQVNLEQLIRQSDSSVQAKVKADIQRIDHLMDEVGFQQDIYREIQGGGGRKVERWPDSSMRYFNAEVGVAVAQFTSAMLYPNDGNLLEGTRRHKEARRAYSNFR